MLCQHHFRKSNNPKQDDVPLMMFLKDDVPLHNSRRESDDM